MERRAGARRATGAPPTGTAAGATGSELGGSAASDEHTIVVSPTSPEVAVSVGVYVTADGPEVLGRQVAEVREYQGQTWVLDEVIEQDQPDRSFSTTITTGAEERMVAFVSTGYGRARFTSGLGEPCRTMGLWDVSDFCNPVLLAGDTHEIAVTGRAGVETAVLVYRPE